MKDLTENLKFVIQDYPDTIRAVVAQEAMEYNNPADFFSDLLQWGCQSGMVSRLIYYTDTRAFYDKYYHEIEGLRYELEESMGERLQPQGDLKNWYAWMGFEETARVLADELNF